MPVPMVLCDHKGHVAPLSNHLNLRNVMVPQMLPLVSQNADTNASSIMWYWYSCQWCYMMKVVIFLLSLPEVFSGAIDDVYTDANGVTWPKNLSCTSFGMSWPKEFSGAIDDTIGITWCWRWCQCHHITKKTYCTSFQLSLLRELSGTTDDIISVTWCQHWC